MLPEQPRGVQGSGRSGGFPTYCSGVLRLFGTGSVRVYRRLRGLSANIDRKIIEGEREVADGKGGRERDRDAWVSTKQGWLEFMVV
ncbi:hypothetical protein HAX54_005598 [Datura stramonium]|uniref:Uncharacterized protein n=1 Tax=Datura stramonium TaxID=4076 RepID=A0ABS8WW09_DATST|nr:hypothetical protein [Datura stramonium]